MLDITRVFEFDAGHRVLGHEGKCRHIHGHRYVAEVSVTADHLDHIGRVVDFSSLKNVVGSWIDENWDHNLLLHCRDPLLEAGKLLGQYLSWKDPWALFDGKQPFIFPLEYGNPTAENIAKFLYNQSAQLLDEALIVTHVRVYETPNCWADYYGNMDRGH